MEHQINILNVAGSRGSNLTPDLLEQYRQVLVERSTSTDI
ncbi:putative molybdenum carrier protein [Spirosoma profusum]|nr:putative molybdenum carrier protein [Spirosoma profusum]